MSISDILPSKLSLIYCIFIFLSIESRFENCAHLEVNCQPGVLVPNQSIEVEISFYPREAKKYHEIIPFEINGLSTMNVEIFGEGTEMKVWEISSLSVKQKKKFQ